MKRVEFRVNAFAGESTLLKYTIGMEIQEGSVYILMKAFV